MPASGEFRAGDRRWTTSGQSVCSEVWATALVVHGHDDELSGCRPVAHGVRESGCGDFPLDDVFVVVVDRWCSGVRPAASWCDCCANGCDESVAQPRLLLLVLLPRAQDISLGEGVEREGQNHVPGAMRDVRQCASRGVPSRARPRQTLEVPALQPLSLAACLTQPCNAWGLALVDRSAEWQVGNEAQRAPCCETQHRALD